MPKEDIKDYSAVDSVLDCVAVGMAITAAMISRAAIQCKGHSENYLKIERYIFSMGYEKEVDELSVTYVKRSKKREVSK